MSYLVGSLFGREAADQLGGPIRIAADFGPGGNLGFVALIHLGRRAFGFDRAAQPVSDPAARWRSPFVLRVEAVRGPPAVGTGAGMGFRIGLAMVLMLMIFATYNDICTLPRLDGIL